MMAEAKAQIAAAASVGLQSTIGKERMRTHSPDGDHHKRGHTHDHGHTHGHDHGHTHGVVDPAIATSDRGLWAIKWSFIGLFITAALQFLVVMMSGSVALLADMIHNFADAATAIPLGIAFLLARKRPSPHFTFGYGRAEDLAGVAIVMTILISAIVAGYASIDRLFHPQEMSHLWTVVAASIIGFLGNEGVAILRIRVGRQIDSAALIADGHHARVDGWTSLSVLVGTIGVWLGYPLADPIVGLLITVAIFGIVIQSGKSIFKRLLEGVDPHVIDEIRHAAGQVADVRDVSDIRARWLGHRLHVEINIAVDAGMTVAKAHEVAAEVRHQLLHQLSYVSLVVIHVDPADQSGEAHHRIDEHAHGGLSAHSHP
jgi:cation diffusion facilitator family transporter